MQKCYKMTILTIDDHLLIIFLENRCLSKFKITKLGFFLSGVEQNGKIR
jgi:hypothetical protein